ncbi:hypothetical protein DFH07DRAFT_855609 [Mycena maculata]|uniref:GST N-terminal domain-containing protein n=1 Tax=Mycena maculata TaxID=230809 RepID=A0AAD7MME1_9AGAR|nr:hypothetical protein DFH07DRAFT_855609 [Mycena maculata]
MPTSDCPGSQDENFNVHVGRRGEPTSNGTSRVTLLTIILRRLSVIRFICGYKNAHSSPMTHDSMPLIIHHLQVPQSERLPWLCEELNIPYTLTQRRFTNERAPISSPQSIKDLNPLGAAPVIQDGGLTLAGRVRRVHHPRSRQRPARAHAFAQELCRLSVLVPLCKRHAAAPAR